MDQIQELQQRLQALQTDVSKLRQRVDQLEGHQVKPTPVMSVAATPSMTATPATAAAPHGTHKVSQFAFLRFLAGFFGFFTLIAGLGAFDIVTLVIGIGLLGLAIAWPWKTTVAKATPSSAAPGYSSTKPAPSVPHTPRQPSQFEKDLAKHWFSWLGIITLVVGIALFLGYSLRQFGPLGNVITAYAVAAMLFGLAAWFMRSYRGFGLILQGGAWAILYMATFFWHNIADGLLASTWTGGTALFIVAILMTMAAVKQNTKTLTAGAFLLGFITALSSSLELFTLTTLLILSAGLVTVSTVKRWPEFSLIGNVVTYIVQLAWMTKYGTDLPNQATTAGLFLIVQVLLYGAAHWLTVPRNAWEKQMIIAGTGVNLLGFYVLFQDVIGATGSGREHYMTFFLAVVSIALAILSRVSKSRAHLYAAYLIFGLSFLTIGFGELLSGPSLAMAWLVESLAIITIGSYLSSRLLRISGYVVTLIGIMTALPAIADGTQLRSVHIASGLVTGIVGAIAVMAAAWAVQRRRSALPKEERWAPEVLLDGAVILGLATVFSHVYTPWVTPAWALIGAVLIILGQRRSSLNGWLMGLTIIFSSLLQYTTVQQFDLIKSLHLHARFIGGILMSLFIFSAAFAGRHIVGRTSILRLAQEFLWWFGMAAVTLTLGFEVAPRLLSVAWGIEGIIFFGLGFGLQSARARRQGLVALIITMIKVYLIDIWSLARPYQILSFIILGAILLLIGYLYNRWRQPTTAKPHDITG